MARGTLVVVALVATLAAACAEERGSEQQEQEHEQVWRGTSQSISIRSFGAFVGSSGYERDRGQLTAEQVALLDAFEVIEPKDECWMDVPEYRITIVDAAGVSRVYRAKETDDSCQGNQGTEPTLSMASLRPFLDTFACIASGDMRAGAPQGAPLVMHPGDGCLHGVFMDGRHTSVRLDLAVAGPGELTIETVASAYYASQVTLLDSDGATVLGVGAEPAARPGSSALTYSFAAAGTYFVEVTSTNAQTGDILLRVR
jgi:hypothetical protein